MTERNPVLAARDPHKAALLRANKHGDRGEHDKAEKIWRKYLKKCPDDPDVTFNVGVCVQRRANANPSAPLFFEAAEYFERVVQNQFADIERKADAMNNLGLIAEKLGHSDKAATSFAFALKMFPGHIAARTNLGDALRILEDYEGAQREYSAVLDQDPNSAGAHMCAGMLALLLGDWQRGWKEYRWRYQVPTFQSKKFESEKPLWEGESLDGKGLLMVAEQGWGDQFQFARYAAELKRRWPTCSLTYHCDPIMHDILAAVEGVDRVAFNPTDGFDYVCPIMDIPHCLGMKSETEIPPAECIRIRDEWMRLFIAAYAGKGRIAIVWAGSPTHGKDKARSITPEQFQPMIDAHPECQFYSLQCGPRQHEVERLRNVIDLAPHVGNWTDTAQMLKRMDLLVTVDTSCVHLAGCLGVPTWMLCPNSPDWRWQLKREDSPWYKKMRLFRQTDRADWKAPIQRITEAL